MKKHGNPKDGTPAEWAGKGGTFWAYHVCCCCFVVLVVGRTKQSRAIILIFNQYFAKNNYFEALEHQFHSPRCLCKPLGFPEFTASITTNHRAPYTLVSKGFLRGGDKCLAAHSNTLCLFPSSKIITSTQRFLNPSAIGSSQIIHRIKIEQTPQPIIIN